MAHYALRGKIGNHFHFDPFENIFVVYLPVVVFIVNHSLENNLDPGRNPSLEPINVKNNISIGSTSGLGGTHHSWSLPALPK